MSAHDDQREESAGTDPTPEPTLRQLLHWATGDRDAEAKALADASDGAVTVEDAKAAVEQAHGDVASDTIPADRDVATPNDARRIHEDSDAPTPTSAERPG